MASLVWLGVVLAVLQSMSTIVGKQLMRYSGIQRLKGTKTALFTAKISLIAGLCITVAISPLLDMASLAFISQTVNAPLCCLAVVWNTLAAPYTLGEILNLPDVIGCALIFGGAVATSLIGLQGDDQEYTLESLKKQFFRWVVLVYITLLGLWLAFNVLVLQPRSAAPKGEPFQTGDKLRGLSLALTAGTLVGNQFCVKALVEVLEASIRDDKPEYWADWFPYILLVGAVAFATSNISFLTRALREYKALLVVPMFEASVILSSCVSGSVVLSALHGLEWWKLCLYWPSLSLVVAGIGTVAYGSALKDKAARRNVGVTEVQDQDPGKIAEASDWTDDHVAVGTAHDPDKIQNSVKNSIIDTILGATDTDVDGAHADTECADSAIGLHKPCTDDCSSDGHHKECADGCSRCLPRDGSTNVHDYDMHGILNSSVAFAAPPISGAVSGDVHDCISLHSEGLACDRLHNGTSQEDSVLDATLLATSKDLDAAHAGAECAGLHRSLADDCSSDGHHTECAYGCSLCYPADGSASVLDYDMHGMMDSTLDLAALSSFGFFVRKIQNSVGLGSTSLPQSAEIAFQGAPTPHA